MTNSTKIIQQNNQEAQDYLDNKFKRGGVKKMSIDEILEGLNEIQDFDERVKALRSNSERNLNTILLYAFDGVQWVLTPEEVKAVKYKPSDDDDQFIQGTNLFQEARRLYIFRIPTLRKDRAVSLLTELLENLHPNEAKVLIGLITGEFPYQNITKDLVATAFPDLFLGYVPCESKEEGKQEEEKTEDPSLQASAPSSPKPAKTPKKPAAPKAPKTPKPPAKPKKAEVMQEEK
jgi:hypothetical protein